MMDLHFRMRASRRRYAVALIAALISVPCAAHHSFAMFDPQKLMTLHGTVKELQWTNPHCFLQIIVPAAGVTAEWSLEMHSPQAMYRLGWRPGSFKPGDKVTVTVAPVKDGNRAGMVMSAIDSSGRTFAITKGHP
jgi:hypothetical protein